MSGAQFDANLWKLLKDLSALILEKNFSLFHCFGMQNALPMDRASDHSNFSLSMKSEFEDKEEK